MAEKPAKKPDPTDVLSDTARLKALVGPPEDDPYNKTIPSVLDSTEKRRTLDDMRRLSEQIKADRPKK